MNSLEIIKDILDHIPNCSYLQIALFFIVIFLIYIIEYLTYYNSILYSPISIPGFPLTSSLPPSQSISKPNVGKRKQK